MEGNTDYKAIFSRDPFGLLLRVKESAEFYIEYRPYQRVPDTIIFKVAGLSAELPPLEMALQKRKYDDNNAATAVLRARILPHVRECRLSPGRWCWADPNDVLLNRDSTAFDTREEAVRYAMQMAQAGVAFARTAGRRGGEEASQDNGVGQQGGPRRNLLEPDTAPRPE